MKLDNNKNLKFQIQTFKAVYDIKLMRFWDFLGTCRHLVFMAKMFIIWTMVCLLPGSRQEIHTKAFQTNMEECERDTEQGDSNQPRQDEKFVPKRRASSVSWRWFGQSHKMVKILEVKGSKSFIFPSIARVTSLWSACRHLSVWPCHPAVTQSPGTCRLAAFLLLVMCMCIA